ncbi:uncharacterized protein (DUF427 family) [Neolewinella xylanilytica]|uniref:Uncharacterized protein (DUF427 family) n=1 Tax=Neolewinella xylanilytica TaxID=1514080 RepID=A0A2S6I2K5_9BACT|nr:DUF427 domain-containing protein [Neolewinella xylanilytica]PPK85398.1 uncharacterized protein (DUF427 family) [Neolewinella xylanilytica]
MMQASWNGRIVAHSAETKVVEGNHYFPPQSLNRQFFSDSATTSHCGWKGDCNYYNLEVDGKSNPDAAWYYPEPYDRAEHIRGHVAFWKGVKVEEI